MVFRLRVVWCDICVRFLLSVTFYSIRKGYVCGTKWRLEYISLLGLFFAKVIQQGLIYADLSWLFYFVLSVLLHIALTSLKTRRNAVFKDFLSCFIGLAYILVNFGRRSVGKKWYSVSFFRRNFKKWIGFTIVLGPLSGVSSGDSFGLLLKGSCRDDFWCFSSKFHLA